MVPCGARGADRFRDHARSRLGQRGEDAAGVEPARTVDREQLVPVDVAGAQRGRGGVPAVGHPDGAAHAEAALGEIEPVTHLAARSVERAPEHVAGIDAALEHAVLDEPSDLIVDERCHDGCAQAEAAPQPAHDVVFAASLPDAEATCIADASFARVEAKHHLAERDDVVPRLHACTPSAIASAVSSVTASQSRASRSFDVTIQLPPIAMTCGSRR